jgi:polysaccharide export outer membrane protein
MNFSKPMNTVDRRALARVTLLLCALALAGCVWLPRAGPLTSQIDGAEAEGALEGLVAPLTADVAAKVQTPARSRFTDSVMRAAEIDPERLGVGDRLDLTIWEGGETALLGGASGMSRIEGLDIDKAGRIHPPFIRAVAAAGTTPSGLQGLLEDTYQAVTVAPQVMVQVRDPRSRLLTVQGAVARPGIYPIERATTRLLPMIAQAGGASLPPEQVEVSIRRGEAAGAETLDAIYQDPQLDVALRPSDRIVLAAIRKRFLVLGATSIQAEIPFATRDLNLLRALAAARGLRDFDADPTGVFVFRFETPSVADAILSGPAPEGLPEGPFRPIVYRLDLSAPGAFFVAQQFAMRDGDAIFVTNAPLAELRKFVQIFTSVLTPIQQTVVAAP